MPELLIRVETTALGKRFYPETDMKKNLIVALLIAGASTALAQSVWTKTFTLYVTKTAIPSATTNITITVVKGSSDVVVGELVLSNEGNVGINYSVDPDFSGTITSYSTNYIGNTTGWVQFLPPGFDTNTQFTGWTTNDTTVAMDIGFNFPFYTASKTHFSAGINGAINLDGGDVPANTHGTFSFFRHFLELKDLGIPPGPEGQDWGDLKVSSDAIVAPFWSSLSIDTNNIRFLKESDRLVVSWTGATNLMEYSRSGLTFQAHLYDDGQIKYLYKFSEDPGKGLIGLQEGDSTFELPPALPRNYQVVLTPVTWISLDSQEGSLEGASSQTIYISVNAESVTAGQTFPVTVNWSDGTSNVVDIAVVAEDPIYALNAIAPPLEAEVNDIAQTNITLANTGNTPLEYSITDTTAQNGGYTVQPIDFSVADLSTGETINFDPEDHDEGYSELIPLDFEFPFYGKIYTNLCVGVNGGLSLGESRPMYTHESWFYYDNRKLYFWRTIPINIYNNEGGISLQAVANPYFILTLKGDRKISDLVGTHTYYYALTEQYLTVDEPVAKEFIAPYWADLILSDNSSIQIQKNKSQCIITWNNMTHRANPKLIGPEENPDGKTWLGKPTTWPIQFPAIVAHNQSFQTILNADGTIVYQYLSLENPEAWTNAIIGLRDISGNITNLVSNAVISTNYLEQVKDISLLFTPNTESTISVTPRTGILQPGETNSLTKLIGDARYIDSPVTLNKSYSIQNAGSAVPMNVSFVITPPSAPSELADSDGDGIADKIERRAGTNPFDKNSTYETHIDGSRTITWTGPTENTNYDRVYVIEYATSLEGTWVPLTTLTNETSFIDTINVDEPSIFYRVTVNWAKQ